MTVASFIAPSIISEARCPYIPLSACGRMTVFASSVVYVAVLFCVSEVKSGGIKTHEVKSIVDTRIAVMANAMFFIFISVGKAPLVLYKICQSYFHYITPTDKRL